MTNSPVTGKTPSSSISLRLRYTLCSLWGVGRHSPKSYKVINDCFSTCGGRAAGQESAVRAQTTVLQVAQLSDKLSIGHLAGLYGMHQHNGNLHAPVRSLQN
jgi:hypothetical protein